MEGSAVHIGKMEVTGIFFELLQVAVGTRRRLSSVPTAEEWQAVFDMAVRQALIGVCADGIDALDNEQRPPQTVAMRWAMTVLQIEKMSRRQNMQAVDVQRRFAKEGFRSCIFKGVGVAAAYYPHPLRRQGGDIDIWLEGGRRRIVEYVRSLSPRETVSYHHIDFSVVKSPVIEVHFFPTFLLNPWRNMRMMDYWKREAPRQMTNRVELPEGLGVITAPTDDVNVIALLGHIMHHFLEEGVGMRQIVDYYYLLTRGCRELDREATKRRLREFHMTKFAGAVMYVLKVVLGMDGRFMIAEPDAKAGRMLLDNIMKGGNFGKYNEDIKTIHQADGPLYRFVRRERYNMRLLRNYTEEYFSEIAYRVFYFFYRKYWNEWRLRNIKDGAAGERNNDEKD